MAAAAFYVTVRVRWSLAEPDGETRCCCCGDVPWLKLWRLEVRVVGCGGWTASGLALCDACHGPGA